jgi:sugar diacid utilization regulator
VRAGGEVLGSVWVAEADRPFDDAAVEALRGAARIAALHLLHHRAAGDLDRQRRAEVVRALLDGTDVSPQQVRSLGLPADVPLTVVAVAPDLAGAGEPEVAMERLVSLITLYAEVYRHRANAVALERVVYVVVPGDRERLVGFAHELVARSQAAIRVSVSAGNGSPATGLGEVHVSRREADDALRVLPRLSSESPVVHVDDVRGQIALQRLEDHATRDPQLRAGKLERLVEHDRLHGSHHVATLLAYLDHFGDVPAAAASLNIHRNTFRYRLGRLVEASGIDLQDADERLITHLQLRFHFTAPAE